jgi:hypothetical protein
MTELAPLHQTLEIRRGHAADQVTVEHECAPAAGVVSSGPIEITGPDAAVVNLGGEVVVTVRCAVCGIVQYVHLRGTGPSDFGQ